jgi:hypothetical protein
MFTGFSATGEFTSTYSNVIEKFTSNSILSPYIMSLKKTSTPSIYNNLTKYWSSSLDNKDSMLVYISNDIISLVKLYMINAHQTASLINKGPLSNMIINISPLDINNSIRYINNNIQEVSINETDIKRIIALINLVTTLQLIQGIKKDAHYKNILQADPMPANAPASIMAKINALIV